MVPWPWMVSQASKGWIIASPVRSCSSRARSSRLAPVTPSLTTLAPRARTAATLIGLDPSGMTTVQSRPRLRAASATAWPWLPELTVITPRASGELPSRESAALKAPRTLNEPVGWSISGLTAPPAAISSAGRAGVRRTWPAMRGT